MKQPSEARRRTLALQERAIRFSTAVNQCCPHDQMTIPSRVVWDIIKMERRIAESMGASRRRR